MLSQTKAQRIEKKSLGFVSLAFRSWMRKGHHPHFATPSETAADVFARLSSPPLEFGVPLLAGRVRAGDVLEVTGTAQWLLSELMAHMVANVVASTDGTVVLLDVQLAHDMARMLSLAQEALRRRGLSEEQVKRRLEQVQIIRCANASQLLCSLRQCEEMAEADAANERQLVLFVDGMTNLFWPNKQLGKGTKRKIAYHSKNVTLVCQSVGLWICCRAV